MDEEEFLEEYYEDDDGGSSNSSGVNSIIKNKITKETEKMLKDAIKEDKETEYIVTGNVGLDLALSDGKGLPIGSSTLLWAEPGCGKTTLIVDVALRLLKMHKEAKIPFKVLYLAVEGSRQLMYSMGAGPYIESKDFFYVEQALTWEQVEAFYTAVLKGHPLYKDVKIIVVDSVQNVLSNANLEKTVGAGDFGTRSRERSVFYSKYLPTCKQMGICNFFVSQVRQRQGVLIGDDKKAAVSWGDRHNVDIIIKCTKRQSTEDKATVETVFGSYTTATKYIVSLSSKGQDCKNRYISGNVSEILLEPGVGAQNWYVLKKILIANKLLKSGGGWYTFNEGMCETFGFPKKLRKNEIENLLVEKESEIINFLRSIDCYCVEPNKEFISSLGTND